MPHFRVNMAAFARLVLLLLLAAAGIGLARPAQAASEERTLRRMVDLNKRAIAAYGAGRHQTAKKILMDAIAAGRSAGLESHDMTARTYVHLGVVALNGLQQREEGMGYFVAAVTIRPQIRLTPKLSTPALEADLEQARKLAPPPPPPPPPAAAAPPPAAPAAAPSSPKGKEGGAPAPKRGRRQAAAEEPDLPATIPQPLYCPLPIEGPPAREVNLRCLTQPDLRVNKVVAYYRPAAGERYAALPMSKSKKGWYTAVIPASHVTGRSLQFYFEALGNGQDVAVRNGKDDSPYVIVLKEGAPPIGVGALAALQTASAATGSASERSPLELRESEQEQNARRALLARRAPGSLWVGVGLGNGWGYHGRQPLERHPRRQVTPGMSSTGLGHVVPELGWQITEGLSLSLQTRHQYLPPSGSGDAEATGAPPRTAHAALARVQLALSELGDFQILGSLALGGGSALRMKVEPARQLGLVASDTVVLGPLVGGLGAGLAYNFNNRFLALAEARALGTAWKMGMLVEINAGAQLAF